jgi:hypothetical protein
LKNQRILIFLNANVIFITLSHENNVFGKIWGEILEKFENLEKNLQRFTTFYNVLRRFTTIFLVFYNDFYNVLQRFTTTKT